MTLRDEVAPMGLPQAAAREARDLRHEAPSAMPGHSLREAPLDFRPWPGYRSRHPDESVAVVAGFQRRHPHRSRLLASVPGWGDLRCDGAAREFARTRPLASLWPLGSGRQMVLTHGDERRWRIFRERVGQVTVIPSRSGG